MGGNNPPNVLRPIQAVSILAFALWFDPVVVTPKRVRPSYVWLGLLVVVILGAGLIGGLAIDAALESRPIGTLIGATMAAQLSFWVVYRLVASSFGRIGPRGGESQAKQL